MRRLLFKLHKKGIILIPYYTKHLAIRKSLLGLDSYKKWN